MTTPHVDIASALADAGLGTLGTDLFYGPVRDGKGADKAPDAAIFVLEVGGFDPVPDLGGANAPDLRERSVQVRVRSAREGYSAGHTTAQAAFTAIHKQHPAAYVSWEAGEPIYIERDESGRHHWSINTFVRTYG
jgi:hypothetical protein